MGPFSHYTLAARLESSIKPEDRKAYFWGAVAPDIRYLANMRRDQTHLSQARIIELMSCYPNLKSFLLGYQVHVLIDQMDVLQTVNAAFPLNLLKIILPKSISPQQMTMMVEMYFLRAGGVNEALLGEHNQVFLDLGITSEQTVVFQQALGEYFDKQSLEAAVSAFQKIGMIENSRLEKYKNAFQSMQKRKVMTGLFDVQHQKCQAGVKNGRFCSISDDSFVEAHLEFLAYPVVDRPSKLLLHFHQ